MQGLLKSLDNAHSLLAKHVETNNKYAESELILQLELDDSKTDCEKYKDELTAKKADIQEKDAQINELKNTMKEKVGYTPIIVRRSVIATVVATVITTARKVL
jgi:septal ring factor EnvC (AmiA/AmiB activator)